MIYGEIFDSSHPGHKLVLGLEERPYTCDGCGELGFGTRYACEEGCNFHLHKACASPPDTITHPFFQGCVFLFLREGEPGRCCDACGKDVRGFVYHCFDRGWDLHPSCAALPQAMEDGEMRLVLRHKVSSKCTRCGKKHPANGARRSWSYVSDCKSCHLHVACVKEILLENWEKEYFGGGSKAHEVKESQAVVSRTPQLQIVIDRGKRKRRKWDKFMKIVKIALTFVMAAVVGDPTSLVATLISSLIAH